MASIMSIFPETIQNTKNVEIINSIYPGKCS